MKLKNQYANLIFVSKSRIEDLNKKYRNQNLPTDVLAFSSVDGEFKDFLGDVYICPAIIKRNAGKFKTPFEEELVRIIIHGTLHLLKYDHRNDFGNSREKMFQIQETLVNKILKI